MAKYRRISSTWRAGWHVVLGLVAMTAASAGCSERVPVDGMRIFVTSTAQNADLGGPIGADQLCATLAADADLDGMFKAWLSTRAEPVSERLAHSAEAYVRIDGRLIAENWNDLVDGDIAVPIDLDENGAARFGDVWTGTLATGEPYQGDDCAGFTSSAAGNAQCGDSESTSSTWTENITPSCFVTLRLYCVEQ